LDHGALPSGHFWTMTHLKALKRLDLSYHVIRKIHNESFDGMKSMIELDISGNQLTFTDTMFRGLEDTLQILRIRDMSLKTLPLEALRILKALRTLDISGNDFPNLDEDFFAGVQATNIWLTDMSIENVSHLAFNDMNTPVSIALNRNNVSDISFILKLKPCTFSRLSLIENPVTCTCDVAHLAATSMVGDLLGTCADRQFRGKKLHSINIDPGMRRKCKLSTMKNEHCKFDSTGALVNGVGKSAPCLQNWAHYIVTIIVANFFIMH
jgi:hypothetical protein